MPSRSFIYELSLRHEQVMVFQSLFNPPPGVRCPPTLSNSIFHRSPKCSLDSGYSFWVIMAPPTELEIKSICQSRECMEIVDTMRSVSATECVMEDGYYLYQDILNPILNQCGSAKSSVAPTIQPAATQPPAAPPVITTPQTTAPVAVPRPTSTESENSTATAIATPRPTTALSPVPSSSGVTATPELAKNTSSSKSSDSSSVVWIVVGCAAGLIVIVALVVFIRQRRKRDRSVQQNQELVYGYEGQFDTEAPMARRVATRDT